MPGKAARWRAYRPGRLAALDTVLQDAGWSQEGGFLLRGPDGSVCGRTPWIARAPWWHERPVADDYLAGGNGSTDGARDNTGVSGEPDFGPIGPESLAAPAGVIRSNQ